MKSVPNLIIYLHKYSRIFSPFLSIFLMLEIGLEVYFKPIKTIADGAHWAVTLSPGAVLLLAGLAVFPVAELSA
jgi:Kef-type K+ transport system membrane component KefB